MFVMLQFISLAALLTVTTAQCSGRLTNSSFVLSWSANNTYVRFTMSAPSNGDQYIGTGFFNSSRLNVTHYICSVDFYHYILYLVFKHCGRFYFCWRQWTRAKFCGRQVY